MYTYHKVNKYFFLTDCINEKVKNKIINFKNLNIIYYNQEEIKEKKIDIEKYNEVYIFCKKNKIPIYITNSIKSLLKLKANGVFITSQNKYSIYPKIKNKIDYMCVT